MSRRPTIVFDHIKGEVRETDQFDAIPWHTEADVDRGVARMKNFAPQAISRELHRIPDEDWRNLARACLGMRPHG